MVQWVQHGASVPFTFGDLQTRLGIADPDALVRTLLGDLTALWFRDATAVASTVLPRQAALFLHQALDRLKARYEQREESKAAAAASYASIADEHKRRRIVSAAPRATAADPLADPLGR